MVNERPFTIKCVLHMTKLMDYFATCTYSKLTSTHQNVSYLGSMMGNYLHVLRDMQVMCCVCVDGLLISCCLRFSFT